MVPSGLDRSWLCWSEGLWEAVGGTHCPKHWDTCFLYIITFDCHVYPLITALLPGETG